MISPFKKLFCNHRWLTHAKEVYSYTGDAPVSGTAHWFTPLFERTELSSTVEVLTCRKCGKIKIIEY